MPTPARGVLHALALTVQLPGRLLINAIDGLKAQNGVGPLNGFQRGAVHGLVWLCALIAFSMAINPAAAAPMSSATITSAAPTGDIVGPTATPAAKSTSNRGPAAPDGEHATVGTITDGDSFQLTDARKVRVLGIDSCEDTGADKTPGGEQAALLAETALHGKQVVLTTEPGVDIDHDVRQLRYVWQDEIGDFGLYRVPWDHTGIYQDDNNASQQYLDQLYAHDLDCSANPPSGRECGSYPPPVVTDDGDVYIDPPNVDIDRPHKPWICRHSRWC